MLLILFFSMLVMLFVLVILLFVIESKRGVTECTTELVLVNLLGEIELTDNFVRCVCALVISPFTHLWASKNFRRSTSDILLMTMQSKVS